MLSGDNVKLLLPTASMVYLNTCSANLLALEHICASPDDSLTNLIFSCIETFSVFVVIFFLGHAEIITIITAVAIKKYLFICQEFMVGGY